MDSSRSRPETFPLHAAVAFGDELEVNRLLASSEYTRRRSIDELDHGGWTPLQFVFFKGPNGGSRSEKQWPHIMKALLRSGADVTFADPCERKTILEHIVTERRFDAFGFAAGHIKLVPHFVSTVNGLLKKFEGTPLIKNRLDELLSTLHSTLRQRDYRDRDDRASSSRQFFDKFERMDIFTLLQSHYNSPTEMDQHARRFDFLVNNSTVPVMRDKNGNSPLMAALSFEDVILPCYMLELLVSRSRDVLKLRNDRGETAFGILSKKRFVKKLISDEEYHEIKKVFLNNGFSLTAFDRMHENEGYAKEKNYNSAQRKRKLPYASHDQRPNSVPFQESKSSTPSRSSNLAILGCDLEHKRPKRQSTVSSPRDAPSLRETRPPLSMAFHSLTASSSHTTSKSFTTSSASSFVVSETKDTPLICALKLKHLIPVEKLKVIISLSKLNINQENASKETAYLLFLKHIHAKRYLDNFLELREDFLRMGLKPSCTERILELEIGRGLVMGILAQNSKYGVESFVSALDSPDDACRNACAPKAHDQPQSSRTKVLESSSASSANDGVVPDHTKDVQMSSMSDVGAEKNLPPVRTTPATQVDRHLGPLQNHAFNLFELFQSYTDSSKRQIELILNYGNYSVDATNRDDWNLLMVALKKKNIPPSILQKLITKDSVNYVCRTGDSALSIVLQNYERKNQERLIRKFVARGLKLLPGENEGTCFEVAVENEVDMEVLELLLKLGLELTMNDLLLAFDLRLDALELVLDYIPWRAVKQLSNALLLVVTKNGSDLNLLETVRRLVEDFKAKLNHVSAKSQMSLIHFLILFSENDIYMSVLTYILTLDKLDINLSVSGKGTPIEYATSLAMHKYAKINRKNRYESMDLHTLLLNQYKGTTEKKQVMDRFRELVTNPNAATLRDRDGDTPLMSLLKHRVPPVASSRPYEMYETLVKISRHVLTWRNYNAQTPYELLLLIAFKHRTMRENYFFKVRQVFLDCGYKVTPHEQLLENQLNSAPTREEAMADLAQRSGSLLKLLQPQFKKPNDRDHDPLLHQSLYETLIKKPSTALECGRLGNTPLISAMREPPRWPKDFLVTLIESSKGVINNATLSGHTAYTCFLSSTLTRSYNFRELRGALLEAGLIPTATERLLEKSLEESLQEIIYVQDNLGEKITEIEPNIEAKLPKTTLGSLKKKLASLAARVKVEEDPLELLKAAKTHEEFEELVSRSTDFSDLVLFMN